MNRTIAYYSLPKTPSNKVLRDKISEYLDKYSDCPATMSMMTSPGISRDTRTNRFVLNPPMRYVTPTVDILIKEITKHDNIRRYSDNHGISVREEVETVTLEIVGTSDKAHPEPDSIVWIDGERSCKWVIQNAREIEDIINQTTTHIINRQAGQTSKTPRIPKENPYLEHALM